jgi:peptidoglycan hydrolase-like protein with peptidoglycan-binding domain
MAPFGDEYELSFEDYMSPFAPSTSRDASPIPALSWEDGPFAPAEVIDMQPATWVGEVAQEALGVESEDFVEREWEADRAGLGVTEAGTPESSDREMVEAYAELEAEMHLAGEPEVTAAEFLPETDFGVAESYAELEAEAYVDSEALAESEDFVEPELESDRQRGVVRRGAFVRCSGRGQPGAKALAAQWTRVSGIKAGVYNCRSTVFGTPSLHGEGRAIDCYANVNDPTQRAQAEAYIAWLQANAVELQVAVVIWNRRIWSWHRRQQGWRGYKGRPHTDHFHVELSWEGALKPSQLLATTPTRSGILAPTSVPQTSSPAGTAPGAKLSLAEFEGGELERATWAGEDNGESTDGLSEPEFVDLSAEPDSEQEPPATFFESWGTEYQAADTDSGSIDSQPIVAEGPEFETQSVQLARPRVIRCPPATPEPATPESGPAGRTAPTGPSTRLLRRRAVIRPAYVRWVQDSLNQILGTRLRVDGILGPMTRASLRQFQHRAGLPADGKIGPQTDRALRADRGSRPPQPVQEQLGAAAVGAGIELVKFGFEGIRTVTEGDIKFTGPTNPVGIRATQVPPGIRFKARECEALVINYEEKSPVGLEQVNVKLRCITQYNGINLQARFVFDPAGRRSRLMRDSAITIHEPLDLGQEDAPAEWVRFGIREYGVLRIPVEFRVDRPWPLSNYNENFMLVLSSMYGFGASEQDREHVQHIQVAWN